MFYCNPTVILSSSIIMFFNMDGKLESAKTQSGNEGKGSGKEKWN